MGIILAVARQGSSWQPKTRWDRCAFDHIVRFCHLRKSFVNEGHDPPENLVHKFALVLLI